LEQRQLELEERAKSLPSGLDLPVGRNLALVHRMDPLGQAVEVPGSSKRARDAQTVALLDRRRSSGKRQRRPKRSVDRLDDLFGCSGEMIQLDGIHQVRVERRLFGGIEHNLLEILLLSVDTEKRQILFDEAGL
jgi:hypothetical protein